MKSDELSSICPHFRKLYGARVFFFGQTGPGALKT